MRNFRMLIAYDGTRYKGWQRLPTTGQTIQGKIEAALSRLFEMPIEISGSGRTDAGAHAKGQVANFHVNTALSAEKIQAYLRHELPEDIGLLELCEVDARFHARLSAKRKTYQYRVWNADVPNVFERRYVNQVAAKLDVEAMQEAALDYLGTHDFLAFCSNKNFKKSSIRKIDRIEILKIGEEIRFTITGDGFLYNMVRIMVGTLIEIGLHRRAVDSIPAIFMSRIREQAGETAPARGLCLMEVEY